MGRRCRDRLQSESLALSGTGIEWMTAKKIAIKLRIGDKWREVAWALQRLEKRGQVERLPLPQKDGEGKIRLVNHYRLTHGASGFLPSVVKRIL